MLTLRPYPMEFRARTVALVCAGTRAKQTAVELGIHPVTLSNRIREDEIDSGLRPAPRHRSQTSCGRQNDVSESSNLSC